jgi:hypothetical protein
MVATVNTKTWRIAALAALSMLAACATTPPTGINVTRFHLGGPIAKGTVFVVPANPAYANNIEFKTYAALVSDQLRQIGFAPIGTLLPAEYVATMTYNQTAQAVTRNAPASVGFGVGGASFGGGGGVSMGTSVQVPVGGGTNMVVTNQLAVELKRRSDQTVIWQGSATSQAMGNTPNASMGNAMPGLVKALFGSFPGQSGATVTVRP